MYLSLSLSLYIYIYIHTHTCYCCSLLFCDLFLIPVSGPVILPAAVRCDMVLHQAFRARHVRKHGISGKARHGVTSGVCARHL